MEKLFIGIDFVDTVNRILDVWKSRISEPAPKMFTYIQTITALGRSSVVGNLKMALSELVGSFIWNNLGMLEFISSSCKGGEIGAD